jgi:L-asparaginase / beta-aspartyl-peptidase
MYKSTVNMFLQHPFILLTNALIILLTGLNGCSMKQEDRPSRGDSAFALVIHGGAGTILKSSMTPEKERQYTEQLKLALDTGYAILEAGGTSTNAVLAVVTHLENSPLFNAGRGAVFTADGKNELDASIMEGSELKAGAVAGVHTIKNPILAAHAVMMSSPHVMLSGSGAEEFAKEYGLEQVDPSYFFDSARYEQWLKVKNKMETSAAPHTDSKFGTVGCVALDSKGNITAGTSTGGMTNKRWGRIGDSPIIGAGTYANNKTCGISCTGWGEYFIRLAIAHDISAQMEYAGRSLEEAAANAIHKRLPQLGGDGGLVGLDARGEIVMTFNTEGMYRGYRKKGEEAKIFIYKN